MKNKIIALAIFSLVLGVPMTSFSETSKTPQATCISNNHKAFDFWIGEWNVTAKGKEQPHAKSSITKANGGCSIHEHYTTKGGYSGNSINFYDADKGQWHQTWIDNQGAPLYLDGNFKDGKMVLSDGVNRISWHKVDEISVNQVWKTTDDQGKTWKIIFDGLYTPVAVK